MKTIIVAAQKGGVGKTTTAVNLGVAAAKAGNRVLIVDLDAHQGSLRFVWNARDDDALTMLSTDPTPGQLPQLLERSKDHFDLVVIDTPPSVSTWLNDVLPLADLTLVVTGTVDGELAAVAKTFAAARNSASRIGFVINRALKDDPETEAAVATLAKHGSVAPVVYDRRVHRGVLKNGVTAVERHYPAAKSEVEALWKFATEQIGA